MSTTTLTVTAHAAPVTRTLETLCRCCFRADAEVGTTCVSCLTHCELPDVDDLATLFPQTPEHDALTTAAANAWLLEADSHEDMFCPCGAVLTTTLVRYAGTVRVSCPACSLLDQVVAA